MHMKHETSSTVIKRLSITAAKLHRSKLQNKLNSAVLITRGPYTVLEKFRLNAYGPVPEIEEAFFRGKGKASFQKLTTHVRLRT